MKIRKLAGMCKRRLPVEKALFGGCEQDMRMTAHIFMILFTYSGKNSNYFE
jgi:hypothetical protein